MEARIKDLTTTAKTRSGILVEVDKDGLDSSQNMLLTDISSFDFKGEISGAGSTITIDSAIYCKDDTNNINISLATGFTKTTSLFTVGDGGGGLDTGVIAANTTYYMFAVGTEALLSDLVFSLSKTSPTLPTGYDYKQLAGSFKTIYYNTNIYPECVVNLTSLQALGENGYVLPYGYINDFKLFSIGAEIYFTNLIAKAYSDLFVMRPATYESSEAYKSLAGTWTAGQGNGLLNTAIVDNTLYALYLISKTNGSEDYYGEVYTGGQPTLPTDYTYYRLIAYLKTGDYSGSSEFETWKVTDTVDLYKIIEKDDDFTLDMTGDIQKTIVFTGLAGSTMNLPASSTITVDGFIRGYYVVNNSDYELKIWIDGGAEDFNTGMNYLFLSPHKKIQIGGSNSGWDLITNCDVNALANISTAWASTNFATLATVPIDTVELEENDSVLDVNTTLHRVTAKITGVHYVSGWGYLSSTSAANYTGTFELYKNGAATGAIVYVASGDKEGSNFSQPAFPISLIADDYLEIKAVHSGFTGNLEVFHLLVKINI